VLAADIAEPLYILTGSRMHNVRLRRTCRTRHPHDERYNRLTPLMKNFNPAPAASETQNLDRSNQLNC
jgi:hypothetical protein